MTIKTYHDGAGSALRELTSALQKYPSTKALDREVFRDVPDKCISNYQSALVGLISRVVWIERRRCMGIVEEYFDSRLDRDEDCINIVKMLEGLKNEQR